MKKVLILFATIFIILSMLCSCGRQDTISTDETVENIFSEQHPTEEVPATEAVVHSISGISSFGYADGLQDDAGTYYVYHGGKMCIPFRLSVIGLEEEGVGMVLFLDGQPQPYHTDFSDTDQYMHTIYPSNLVSGSINLYFVPQSGQAGDSKTMDFLLVPFPGQGVSDGKVNTRFIGLKRGIVSRLVYEAAPPAADTIPVTERVLAWSAQLQDLTSEEIAMWSAENYQTKVEATFCANGMKNFGTEKAFDEDTVQFQLELKGAPDAEYALTVFINDQPVSVTQDNRIIVSTENGQKLVVEITLDVSDIAGDFSLYAALSPTVYRTEGWDDNFISDYFFFTR